MFITVSAIGTVPFSFRYTPTTHIQAFEMEPLHFTVIIITADHFPLIWTTIDTKCIIFNNYLLKMIHLIGHEKHSVLL